MRNQSRRENFFLRGKYFQFEAGSRVKKKCFDPVEAPGSMDQRIQRSGKAQAGSVAQSLLP